MAGSGHSRCYLSLSLHKMQQDGYDTGSETNPNSMAESESDSSDECDLTH